MTKQDNYHKQELQFAHIIPMLDVELAKHPGFEATYFYRGLDGHGDNDCLIFYNNDVICHLEGWNWGDKSWGSATRLQNYTARLMAHVNAGHLRLHAKFSKSLIFTGGASEQHCMAGYKKAGWRIYGHHLELTATPFRYQLKWLKQVIKTLVKRLVMTVNSNVFYKTSSMPVSRAHGVVGTVYELLARLIARILLVFRDSDAQRTPPETDLSIRRVEDIDKFVDLYEEAKIAAVSNYLYIQPFAYVREEDDDD